MANATRWASLCLAVVLGAACATAACGGDGNGGGGGGDQGTADGGDGATDDSGNIIGPTNDVTSLTIDPPMAAIEVLNGAAAAQIYTATAKLNDGTTVTVTKDATWTVTNLQVGAIDSQGLYKASGSVGGLVKVTAKYKTKSASAALTVKIHIQENPGNVPGAQQSALKGATTPDATVVWAYPYNGTVFPRGLDAPTLMWNGSAAADSYYVHLLSPTYELESFTLVPPPSRFAFSGTSWQKFVDSTEGASQLKVARWNGTAATVVADHTWTVAPQSMRGTIYYWANNMGRVMRIKPGATMPDDFAFKPPLDDTNVYPSSSCLMTCHTVSADGSTLVSGGGSFGGSYDLRTGMPKKSLGGVWGGAGPRNDWYNVQWMMPAVSPDGAFMLVNSMATELSRTSGPPGPNNFSSLYDTTTGMKVPNSGLDGTFVAMPAFAPDGSRIAYVDSGDPTTWGTWINPGLGPLRVFDFDKTKNPMAFNAHDLVAGGTDPSKRISWPSVCPDAKWIIYQRGDSADTRGGNADLYLASATTPGVEIRLGKLDGDGYPFAAGARDLSWSFEPAFAPVAAGGYFWVVFTSRRTYGNILTGDKTVVKQLWVAAIDQAPTPGTDPSHPPFRLPGQAVDSINMRGFWALDPCKGDGQGCMSGTECCGGYCDGTGGDGGGPVCVSQTTMCAQNGDRCQVTADCCNASSGVTCINHVCSEPPPR